MKLLLLLGRVCYSAIFIVAALGHFSQPAIAYAAGQGVPMASILVPLSGILSLLGGLSILLGFKARLGAWMLILFLVPATWMMHQFWMEEAMTSMQMQRIMFMKNLSMLGGAFIIAYFGSGPYSLSNKR